MENNQLLFGLTINGDVKSDLVETAKWARFLAIAALVFLLIAILGIAFFAYYIATLSGEGTVLEGNPFLASGFGMGLVLFYILLIGVWIFPILSLLRFANKMKTALAGNDQAALASSFQSLKICFRFVGIITLIILSTYVLFIAIALIGAALL